MLKTDSKLYKLLEPKTRCQIPVVDASFSLLYLQLNLPSTFGGVAKCILSDIMDLPGNVYVADRWLSPSIKDKQRKNSLVK